MQSNGSPIDRLYIFINIISLLLSMHFDTHCGLCSYLQQLQQQREVYFIFALFMQAECARMKQKLHNAPLISHCTQPTVHIMSSAVLVIDEQSFHHFYSVRLRGDLHIRKKKTSGGWMNEMPTSVIDGA